MNQDLGFKVVVDISIELSANEREDIYLPKETIINKFSA